MINELTRYGAITAKVRTMYARRIRDEDWAAMASMQSVVEVGKYLADHPGWHDAFATLPAGILHRGQLETALRQQLIREFVKLYQFAGPEDKRFLLYHVRKAEYEITLHRLRTLLSGTTGEPTVPSEFLLRKIALDFAALSQAGSWREILAAVTDTIFHKHLLRVDVSLSTGLPDYTAVSVLLQGIYYASLHKFVLQTYRGAMQQIFLASLGQEIDLLNLIHIMRLKKYFPKSPQLSEDMLFPVFYKLRPDFFRALIATPDYAGALYLLQDSSYGKFFSTYNFAYIDQYYARRIYDFNRKQLASGKPTPYVSAAYLSLKEAEMRRLFGVIETAHYRS